MEFPEHTGVPSQDCLIGALGFAHANLEGLHIFVGGEKKKRCPRNIISQSSHRWCSKLNHAFVTSQKKMHNFEISLPTTTVAWLKHTTVSKSGMTTEYALLSEAGREQVQNFQLGHHHYTWLGAMNSFTE